MLRSCRQSSESCSRPPLMTSPWTCRLPQLLTGFCLLIFYCRRDVIGAVALAFGIWWGGWRKDENYWMIFGALAFVYCFDTVTGTAFGLSWPPKAAIIFYRCNFFVSIDERPAMGSQPNLASRSEVVSIYKCPQKYEPPQIWDAKTWNFFTTFSATFALDTAYLRNETYHRQTKMLVSVYSVSP